MLRNMHDSFSSLDLANIKPEIVLYPEYFELPRYRGDAEV